MPATLDLIRLQDAVLCENCLQISTASGPNCPGCGSVALALVKPMLEKSTNAHVPIEILICESEFDLTSFRSGQRSRRAGRQADKPAPPESLRYSI